MSHNISLSENPNTEGEIGRLTILATAAASPYGQAKVLKVSRVRGGLAFRSQDGLMVHVHGEDLTALRALINEIPEELFVEPKPANPARWTEGDEITTKLKPAFEAHGDDTRAVWIRGESVWTKVLGSHCWSAAMTDAVAEQVLADTRFQDAKILTQASGQDL